MGKKGRNGAVTAGGSRRLRKGRVAAVNYDKDAHRAFVTGFRKRKDERRLIAKEQIKREEKEKRREAKQTEKNLRGELRKINEESLREFFGETSEQEEDADDGSKRDSRDEEETWCADDARGAGSVRTTVSHL